MPAKLTKPQLHLIISIAVGSAAGSMVGSGLYDSMDG